MSGPQGSDPNQQWAPPPSGQPGEGQEQPSGSPEEHGAQEAWQQPPAYTPQQYPSYQPQSTPPYAPPQQYPSTEQFGQVPQYGQPGQYAQPGQYGQPGEYGQQTGQFGQPGQPGQPGQYGQFPQYGPPASDQGSKRSLTVIGGVIGALAAIIIAVVLVLGFWKPGFFVTTKLDVNKAQTGVRQILTDETNGYGAKNVKDVKCNNGQNPTVKKGDTFNCEVSVDGTKRQVTVTFQDNNGTYEVGRPK
jgi:Domain of unknown function (DUF4333)